MIRLISVVTLPLVSKGIEWAVSRQEDIEGLVHGLDPQATVDLVREHPADVLLLDLGTGRPSRLTVLSEVVARTPALRILVLGSPPDNELALRLLNAGAHGYICQLCTTEELLEAVRAVHRGERYLSSDFARTIALEATRPSDALPHKVLSNREFEVFVRLAHGESPRSVAQTLGLAVSTVHTHRQRVLGKMGASRDADLIQYAIRHNIIA